jgi:hypothetical protein
VLRVPDLHGCLQVMSLSRYYSSNPLVSIIAVLLRIARICIIVLQYVGVAQSVRAQDS